MHTYLWLAHLLGLGLAFGAATVKLTLLVKSGDSAERIGAFIGASKTLTKQIVFGMLILTITGIVWLIRGYPLSLLLYVKIAIVAALWVLGPVIGAVIEPRFERLAPATGQEPTSAFLRTKGQYIGAEVIATGLLALVIVLWVLR